MEAFDPARRPLRKRKAESQTNERLSKRLSLLNLEQNGSKLYVPVETPSAHAPASSHSHALAAAAAAAAAADAADDDDAMHVDDSKHKVYIYNMDDELSSDSEGDEAKLVFLPDIEKHLKANRIPPSVLANSDGELAGMQLVLYNDPRSLSVPEDKDSVRKAIIESRHRLREQQRLEREGKTAESPASASMHHDVAAAQAEVLADDDPDAMDMD